MTGMRQNRCPPITLLDLKAVAEEPQSRADAHPVGRIGQSVVAGGGGAGEHGLPDPLDQPLGEIVLAHGISRMLTPGRPSGVSFAVSSRSMPASHLQPMTEVAKPVSLSAAARTQRWLRRGNDDAAPRAW